MGSQASYLLLLTLPVEERDFFPLEFAELQRSATRSGEGLLALAGGENKPLSSQLQTRDGYRVEPWFVMVQIISHATEHREQIKSMPSALGVTPPYRWVGLWGSDECAHPDDNVIEAGIIPRVYPRKVFRAWTAKGKGITI